VKKTQLKSRKKLAKKTWLKSDGTAKRGYTKTGAKSKVTITRKLDNLARKACHDRGYCEAKIWRKYNPPKTTKGACNGGLQWCHIVGRRHKKIRWSPLNCLCMCASCHAYFTDHSAEFGLMVEELYPGRLVFLAKLDKDTQIIDTDYWMAFYKGEL